MRASSSWSASSISRADQRGPLVNNYDWFKDMGFLRFIREVGKHITVNYMMAKDSVKNRLETGCPSPSSATSWCRATTSTG
jgi:tyrosyl-tRNA synthetase